MIILTQDKKAIHNFDNVLSIQVEGKRIIVYDEINDSSALGTYETQDRAKEVLNDISDWYCRNEFKFPVSNDSAIVRILSRNYSTYVMPEK